MNFPSDAANFDWGVFPHLNSVQKEALADANQAILVVAGAGTGKTRVLTCRIGYLLLQGGVYPEEILAVTFSNKAAREMAHRVSELLPFGMQPYAIGTFHSICVRLLREFGTTIGIQRDFVIYDDDDQKSVWKELFKEFNLDEARYPIPMLAAEMERAKNQAKDPEKLAQDQQHAKLFKGYRERLRNNNALDFNDLLYYAVVMLRQSPETLKALQGRWRHLLVDEYQDINYVQKELIHLLKGEHNTLFVVGDEDQSIYGWRGADVSHILDFDKDFPNASVHKLEENYRSTKKILDVANAVIANNRGRRGKKLWTSRTGGPGVTYTQFRTEREEAEFAVRHAVKLRREATSNKEAAIFYRTNAQSRVVEEAAMRLGVPYQVVGGVRFYERMEIKDTLAYIRFLYNPNDSVSFRRIIKTPSRGIGEKTVDKILSGATTHATQPHNIVASIEQLASESGAVGKKLQPVAQMLRKLNEMLKQELPLSAKIEQIMLESGYLGSLRAQATEEAQNRIDNVYELLTAVDDFSKRMPEAGLGEFLQHVSLMTDVDSMADKAPGLTLMTLHASKGLEFDYVFLTGLEEGLFPHKRTLDDPDGMEEERRLCYVGMTRAQEYLHLSSAASRKVYNDILYHPPSRFLGEIPEELVKTQRMSLFGQQYDDYTRKHASQDDWW